MGNGAFETARTYHTGDSYFPKSIAVGDFIGDAALDLAASTVHGISIFPDTGDGDFLNPINTSARPGSGIYGRETDRQQARARALLRAGFGACE